MPDRTVSAMLKDRFKAVHANAAVRHFTRMIQDFQQREWEDANAKAGKVVEAVLKACWAETGKPVPKGKAFKVDNISIRLRVKPLWAIHYASQFPAPAALSMKSQATVVPVTIPMKLPQMRWTPMQSRPFALGSWLRWSAILRRA